MDDTLKQQFIRDFGWENAEEQPVGADWSGRRITRLRLGNRTSILMQSPPDANGIPGHKVDDFVRISTYLRGLKLSAPQVYAASPEEGLLLVEDFGTQTYHDLLQDPGVSHAATYMNATDILIHLYRETGENTLSLPLYTGSHVDIGKRRIIDWFVPAVRGFKNEDGLSQYYMNIWSDIERRLPMPMQRFLHGDFHPHNLMWIEEADGNGRTGIVDFQGAMYGSSAYDLVNLLEDARRDVPAGIQNMCLLSMQQSMSREDWDVFAAWYPVLACQFHCRIIGQAIRLALQGKTHLMEHIPLLQRQLQSDLLHPSLWPMEAFLRHIGLDFNKPARINLEALRPLIRGDAV